MTPADIVGRKVLNRYKIVEKIGGGGMSVVWKAYDLVLDRNVALKVLRPEMSEDEEFIQRFWREAQSVASLSHPNIVNIYDVGEDKGIYFIVMELIEGETLRDKMNKEGPLQPEEALRIASGILEALSHAHLRRIIHRDIKPKNILLTKDGSVKVADFGIARALGAISTTSRDLVVGSAPYISPEQAKNGVVSTKSDLYSLGIVLYEMLSGRQPFSGDSPIAVALQHVESDALPLSKVNPSLPKSVEQIVSKAMKKELSERYDSAAEMRRDIERVLAKGMFEVLPRRKDRVANPSAGTREEDVALARPKEKRTVVTTATKVFLVIALLALGMGGYALSVFMKWLNVPTVLVPDLTGKTYYEAQEEVKALGLSLMVSAYKNDPLVPVNVIISQSPLPDEEVKEGREIWCLVSKGQDLIAVPDLLGETLPEASIEIMNAGLLLGDVRRANHETVPKDEVISQNPKAGLEVPKNTAIDLVISSGPVPQTSAVPNLLGLTTEEAEESLTKAILSLGPVTYQTSSGPEGRIIAQDPPEGTEVAFQTKVAITVSVAETGLQNTFSRTFHVPKSVAGTRPLIHVVMTLKDARGERVVYDRLVPPEIQQTVQFRWEGSEATLTIDMGGQVSTETIVP